jgi:hypothetical protein
MSVVDFSNIRLPWQLALSPAPAWRTRRAVAAAEPGRAPRRAGHARARNLAKRSDDAHGMRQRLDAMIAALIGVADAIDGD